VRKRIAGTRGETRVGDVAGVPFDVVGLELHYRAPFVGFVDVLTPSGDGFGGRATFRGRTFGRFVMTPIRGGAMSTVNEQLMKHVAERANDPDTVAACDEIIAQERAMADTIAANWDKFAELSLRKNGVTVS